MSSLPQTSIDHIILVVGPPESGVFQFKVMREPISGAPHQLIRAHDRVGFKGLHARVPLSVFRELGLEFPHGVDFAIGLDDDRQSAVHHRIGGSDEERRERAQRDENVRAGVQGVGDQSSDGKTVYASATVTGVGEKWQKFSATLKTGQVRPTADARFVISGAAKGTLNFNLVSLFPPTYKNRVNGNRADIMQLLADMKPAFLRFPGGNYVEGSNPENRWDWPKTIGQLEERAGHMSPWGYRSSDGLGMLEYLEWCEDLGMEPVLAVYAGLCLDGGRTVKTGEALRPFIQEALDAIEYVTGDENTTWGARRAQDGHPDRSVALGSCTGLLSHTQR